jgi:hypothetical protein
MKTSADSKSIFEAWVAAAVSFDGAHKSDLKEAEIDIERLTPMFVIMATHFDPSRIDVHLQSLALLARAKDASVSALQLVRHGATPDAMALLRVALESAAVAVQIARDRDAFKRYCRASPKHYQAPKAITAMKELIPKLPEMHGALSQLAVHPNIRSFGPRQDREGTITLHLNGAATSVEQNEIALAAIRLCAVIVFRAFELAFFATDPTRPGWLVAPDGQLKTNELGESLVEEACRAMIKSSA